MRKNDYLTRDSVQEFVEWMAPRLDTPDSLPHRYYHIKSKMNWHCDSLYTALLNYIWGGNDFHHNTIRLDSLAQQLRQAITEEDHAAADQSCADILSWGKVTNKNRQRVAAYGNNLVPYLKEAGRLLHPEEANTTDAHEHLVMNSGFTKIYSLLIDDFIIYDSRVGAALGLLVLKFCQEKRKQAVPDELRFAYGNAKGDAARRCPDHERYRFTPLRGSSKTHIIHNLRANWLLKETLRRSNSKFSSLRELEAALFMIGYDISCSKHQTA